ncbi:MAG TPA: flagellar motor protein MotB [Polyangiaceae bacterium]|jgi:chemotaxis protein MotB|nr:flagellar motor protein MotB [Polyangiaceae bacterium]
MAGAGASGGGTRIIYIKKKGKGHAAHHGGAWKVAYADFVTAMMALFMVLWLLSQTDQETRTELSDYFRTGVFTGAPSVLNGGSGIQAKGFFDVVGSAHTQPEQVSFERVSLAVRAQLTELAGQDAQVKQLKDSIKVSVTEEGLLIQILDGGQNLLFDLSSAELKPKLIEILELIAPVLARLDNQIQVHGHTDARPFPAGSGRSNWQLSFERADRARAVLEKGGLRAGQVSGVFAHGATALMNPDEPFAPENRRLSILAVRKGMEKMAARGRAPDAPDAPKAKTAPPLSFDPIPKKKDD